MPAHQAASRRSQPRVARGLTRWQAAALLAVAGAGWVWAASFYGLSRRARALTQPWVTRRVLAETPAILRFQRFQHKLLDGFFFVLSCVVSVPFYMGFLPLLFSIPNFIKYWKETIKVDMDFDKFGFAYPLLPQLSNHNDSGVFVMKYLEVWEPSSYHLDNFSDADIPNIRILYASQMVFNVHDSQQERKDRLEL